MLGRLARLDMTTAAYMAAIARYPKRNIALRDGGRIIKVTTSQNLNRHATRTHAAGQCASSAGSGWKDLAP